MRDSVHNTSKRKLKYRLSQATLITSSTSTPSLAPNIGGRRVSTTERNRNLQLLTYQRRIRDEVTIDIMETHSWRKTAFLRINVNKKVMAVDMKKEEWRGK